MGGVIHHGPATGQGFGKPADGKQQASLRDGQFPLGASECKARCEKVVFLIKHLNGCAQPDFLLQRDTAVGGLRRRYLLLR